MSAPARLAIRINLKTNGISQYADYDFNSFATLPNGSALAANEDGLYSLNDADTDNGTNIVAFFETVTTNFGSPIKTRKSYIDGEFSGELLLKAKADDESESVYLIRPLKDGQKQHKLVVPMTARHKGSYWMFRIENRDGCDFSVDSLDLVAIVLSAGR